MKKFFVLLLIVALALCGCSNRNGDNIGTVTTTQSEEPMPYPFTINGVEVKKQPERVVCLSPAIAEIIYEVGYGDKIIARSSYCDYPADILAAEDVGSSANPDISRITDMMPDMVITSSPIASKDLFTMEQAGITTVMIPAPTTLEGFSSIYSSVGLIFEGMFTGADKGNEVYSSFSEQFSNPDKINIGKFIYITENLSVAGGDTFESAVLSNFGTNIAQNSSGYEYDINELAENQPDYIIINDKYTAENLAENEVLSQLDAVTKNKIIYVDNTFFERPSSRITQILKKLTDDYKAQTLN